MALSNRAQLAMLAQRTRECVAAAERAIALAAELGDDETSCTPRPTSAPR